MIGLEIKRIEHTSDKPATKRDLNTFVDVLWQVCNLKEHPQWVPPLRLAVLDGIDVVKNPFYKRAKITLFIAYLNGKHVGRIAAIWNRGHNEYHEENIGFYGFFECINNQEVANALFDAAAKEIKNWGLVAMRGPMNPSTNHECGLLIRGQSQHPMIMTTWNPKYYEELHDQYGLKGVKDLVAYFLLTNEKAKLNPKLIERAEKLKVDSGLTFRSLKMKDFHNEIDKCFDIYNAAWEKNWGFFPMTREEFQHMAKEMKMVVNPKIAFMAEKDGVPAGFMLPLPDFNQIFKRIPSGRLFPFGIFKILIGKYFMKTVRVVALGVKPEFQKGGIFSLFTLEAFTRASGEGIVAGEASWILEDNVPMNKPWQDMGAPVYRRWRIYEKAI